MKNDISTYLLQNRAKRFCHALVNELPGLKIQKTQRAFLKSLGYTPHTRVSSIKELTFSFEDSATSADNFIASLHENLKAQKTIKPSQIESFLARIYGFRSYQNYRNYIQLFENLMDDRWEFEVKIKKQKTSEIRNIIIRKPNIERLLDKNILCLPKDDEYIQLLEFNDLFMAYRGHESQLDWISKFPRICLSNNIKEAKLRALARTIAFYGPQAWNSLIKSASILSSLEDEISSWHKQNKIDEIF